jgi:glycosyltransferase involved in cell wall biosynthesis
LAELGRHHTLTAFDATHADATLASQLHDADVVLYLARACALAPSLIHLMRAAPGVLWLHGHATDTPRDPGDAALLLRDAGLQGLHAWLAEGRAVAPGRSVFEALYCLILDHPADAAPLRRQHGMALPPLSLLTAGDTPAARADKLAGLLADAHARAPRAAAIRIARHWNQRPADAVVESTAAHAQANLMSGRAPRLLIDVTQLARTDALSGIQRVVRNIARELSLLDAPLPPIELVQLHDGRLQRAGAVAARLFGHPADAVPEGAIDIHPGDLLFMIDSSWEQYPDFAAVFATVRQLGGRIVTVVYDLIPLRMPQFCSPGLVAVFQHWLALAVQHSDMLLCISRAVRDDVAAWLDEHDAHPDHPLELEYWRLGADIVPDASDQAIRPEVAAMAADTSSPLFMMVGTIEPRKGHNAVLDAFDALWAEGSNARLCLAGKEGWQVEDLMLRIRRHPELNRRLFFVERFTDAEINLCYSRAQALLAASVAEGYGLPIVEAAQHRVPVIATDIPVFREVAGAGAAYFPLGDRAALMALVRHFCTLDRTEREAMADLVEVLSWRDSARQAWHKLSKNQTGMNAFPYIKLYQ